MAIDRLGVLDESGDWENAVQDAIGLKKPIVVEPGSRQILAMDSHQDALSLKMQRDLLHIFGSHGEILVPFAVAVRQNLWPDLKKQGIGLTHIDSHFDSLDYNTSRTKSPISPGGKLLYDHYSSGTSRNAMQKFLNADWNVEKTFADFVEIIEGDIDTFICALGPYLSRLSAYVRRVLTDKVTVFDKTIKARSYPIKRGKTIDNLYADGLRDLWNTHNDPEKTPLSRTLTGSTAQSTLFSIDADFCGVNDEVKCGVPQATMDARFERFLDILIRQLNVRTDLLKAMPADDRPACLWGLSIDKEWCFRDVDFTIHFLREFYLRFLKEIYPR